MKMINRKNRLLNIIFSAIVLSSTLISCKKYNQIDNASTVKTPFVMYAGGYYGTLQKTNDLLFLTTLFPTDNSVVRQVLVADTTLLYLKKHMYYSKNEGKAFQPSNPNTPLPFVDDFYKYYFPNSALYDEVERKVYLCRSTDTNALASNQLTVSTDYGMNFTNETNWSSNTTIAPFNTYNPTSITQLDNKVIYAIKDTIIWEKIGTNLWDTVNTVTKLPFAKGWYISHSHDTLIAIDYFGKNGIYYSTDGALNWNPCKGMPKNRRILFGNQALNGTFYIGYDSLGMYRLEGENFKATGAGIPWYAKVSYVTGKRVVYRTGEIRNYLFCATDQGMYISETNGLDWRLHKQGSFSTLH